MDLARKPLSNAFVRLEPLEARHREPLRPLADDPALWTQTSLNASAGGFDAWFDAMIGANAKGAQISYAVYDKRRGAHAGHTSYLAIAPEHDRVEIGWTWYGADFHRTHVNPAAKRLLLAHAFACGTRRVELKTGSHNLRSQGAMEKLGAVRDGVLRSHAKTWTGERRDSVFYSILAEEWPAVRDRLDARLLAHSGLEIAEDDPARPEATALLERHLAFTREASPPGTCFALDVAGLKGAGVRFWTARRGGSVVGCIALKAGHLEPGHGEIKSFHCAAEARGGGVGAALASAVIGQARAEGLTRLSLETGRSDGFAPSRRLYAEMGFAPCPAFGPYKDGTFSYCMTRTL
ncbi:MAG: GNAT family N-acetyltransferase [Oceanicaulis sp.]